MIVGRVIGIKDGDTIELLVDGKPVTIRLFGVDCPEKSQAFGKAAKQYTSAVCFGKVARVEAKAKRDRYKRVLGVVYVGNVNLNEALLRKGLAWHYTQYSDNIVWARLEDSARIQRLGLWNDPQPMAPWLWRKAKRKPRLSF
jgi:micrococcal nuclease